MCSEDFVLHLDHLGQAFRWSALCWWTPSCLRTQRHEMCQQSGHEKENTCINISKIYIYKYMKLIVGRCILTPKFQDSRFWGRLKAKSISGEQYWELRHRDASIDHTACSPSHMRPRCEQHLGDVTMVSLKLTPVLTTVQLFDVMLFACNCMILWNVDGLRRTCLSWGRTSDHMSGCGRKRRVTRWLKTYSWVVSADGRSYFCRSKWWNEMNVKSGKLKRLNSRSAIYHYKSPWQV